MAFSLIGFTSCDDEDEDEIAVEKIELSEAVKEGITLKTGENYDLKGKATIVPSNANATITYTTSDEKIAKIEGEKIVAVAVGEATITVKAGGKSTTFKVTVAKDVIPVESVILADDIKNGVELNTGETLTIADKVTVKPGDATNKAVTYSSSDAKIATIDKDGKITAVAAGEATITVKAEEKSATLKVTVKEKEVAVESVVLADDIKNGITLKPAETLAIADKVTVTPDNATNKTLTYTSSDEKIATVDKDGKITAVAAGEATITVKAEEKSATFKVTVEAVEDPIAWLDRTEWTIAKASHDAPLDAKKPAEGPHAYMLDGDQSTLALFVKPGKSYGDPKVTAEATDDVFFIVDMQAEKSFNYMYIQHRTNAASFKIQKISLYGSNTLDGTYELIKADIDTEASVAGQHIANLDLGKTVKYRYVKAMLVHDPGTGSTMGLAEFNLGTKK